VSEGKNDPIYNAHSYHTKVPHKAIMRYILHYTQPGDIVFDGFCGTGMTGVAAQMCGDRFPIEQMYHGSRIAPKGFTHVHHFFLPRAAHALAALWRKAKAYPQARVRHMLLYLVEQAIWGMSVLARYAPTHFSQVNQHLSGVYYIGSQIVDVTPWYILDGKLSRLKFAFTKYHSDKSIYCSGISTTANLQVPNEVIDYIFTDPPFGENIYYADLNFLVESWHGVITDAWPEAIVDKAKHKGMSDYQHLMERCFREYHRVLKPGRWMTVVFHNSRNAVWNAIQEAMLAAGFVVADVRTLDKQQGSYRQVTSTAVKQDLVISAYKPNGGLEQRFALVAGTEDGVWDFIRTHLRQLPVFVARAGEAEVIVERSGYFLFDRMVAFHVQRGVTVPLDGTGAALRSSVTACISCRSRWPNTTAKDDLDGICSSAVRLRRSHRDPMAPPAPRKTRRPSPTSSRSSCSNSAAGARTRMLELRTNC
jgi:hypothetical protein